jgi:hypothetical protein
MSEDVLDKFRRLADPKRRTEPPAPPQPALVHRPGALLPYVAFDAKDKALRLDIRGRKAGHRIPYGYMPILTYTPWTFAQLIITVSNLVVVVRGQRLEPIADAIGLLSCDFIQEYDPEHFLEPGDASAPFITSIETKLRHGMDLDGE